MSSGRTRREERKGWWFAPAAFFVQGFIWSAKLSQFFASRCVSLVVELMRFGMFWLGFYHAERFTDS